MISQDSFEGISDPLAGRQSELFALRGALRRFRAPRSAASLALTLSNGLPERG